MGGLFTATGGDGSTLGSIDAPMQYHTMATGGSSSPASPESHLDSVFENSRWTREDILVIAATLQIGLWLILLYAEVRL